MINENDYVLLILPKKRVKTWLIKIKTERFQTHRGWIDLSDLIGMKYGSFITSSTGQKFLVLQPRPKDFIRHSRKITQVIYPDDSLAIIGAAAIGPGSRIIELTGSGALTTFLAYHIQPNGHIFSYDAHEEHLKIAQANLERIGLDHLVTWKKRNIKEGGFDEKDLDAIILDMPDPWEALTPMRSALKAGGVGVFFLPNWPQIEQTIATALKKGFWIQEVFELSRRNYLFDIDQQILRPETRGILFTGIILVTRCLANQENT
ncbi:MAG: tRNA (adenine-N1)-methyltransferase [Promethearchaeota archaeon]